jgi:hypothetical protein
MFALPIPLGKNTPKLRIIARFARFARLALTLAPSVCASSVHEQHSFALQARTRSGSELDWPHEKLTEPHVSLEHGHLCPRDHVSRLRNARTWLSALLHRDASLIAWSEKRDASAKEIGTRPVVSEIRNRDPPTSSPKQPQGQSSWIKPAQAKRTESNPDQASIKVDQARSSH